MIDQLITALSKEVEMSAAEIADTIWLALQLHGFKAESVSYDIQKDERTLSQPQSNTTQLEEIPNQRPKEQKAGIYLPTEQKTSKSLGLSFKVPDAPSLREPLTLARALKPLMRRVPSGRELVLDEVATIQRIANEGLWIPVLKPTVEPWLDLELVIDEAISMQIWRRTIRELERLLKNYGIFRDVRVWGLIADENEQVQIRRGIGAAAKNQTLRSPKELIDPSGRRLVLVVSDCISSLWPNGGVTPVLELWAKQGSMAIVQMLPNWLWKRTALGRASEVRLRALTPRACNQKLIAKEVSFWDELEEETGVKVPVFTLEQDKVATWAQMLSGKGNIWTLGYVFKLNATPVDRESSLFITHSDLSAEQRVQAFRVTASPMARKLAGLLASAPVISLPTVRLIRETLLKDSQQVHVAEVFLGGLLKPLSEINADTNPDYVQYEFIDGIRDLLIDSVPSQYVLNVVDEVSKYVAKKAGLSLDNFAAVLKNSQQIIDSEIAGIDYFATVTAQVLRCLGGEYIKMADSIENTNFSKNTYHKIEEIVSVNNKNLRKQSSKQVVQAINHKINNPTIICVGDSGAGKTSFIMQLANSNSEYIELSNSNGGNFKDFITNNVEELKTTGLFFEKPLDFKVKLPSGIKEFKIDCLNLPDGEFFGSNNQEEFTIFLDKFKKSQALVLLLPPYKEILNSGVKRNYFMTKKQWCNRFDFWVNIIRKNYSVYSQVLLCLNKADLFCNNIEAEAEKLAYKHFSSQMNWYERHDYVYSKYFRPVENQIQQIIKNSGDRTNVMCFMTTALNRSLLELPYIYLSVYL